MTSQLSLQSNIKAGMCPHGFPHSSCPVCSKQNGAAMGSSSMHKSNRPSGEWSYQKCHIVGLEIKAAMQRKEAAQTFFEKQFQTALSVSRNLQSIQDKLNNFIQNIKTPILQNSMQFLMNIAINPLFNAAAKLSKFIGKIAEFQQKSLNMIFQAGEKLVSILGEVKNFIERKIIGDLKKRAKKFMSFCLSVIEDENYKNDDTLAVFKSRELKKYIVKILKKRKKNEN